jgi:serine 3-dehydrogenase
MDMNGKTVLITGASAGIGRACAEVFAEAGAKVIISARRLDKIDELAAELIDKYTTEVLAVQCDVRNYAEVEEAFGDLPEEWSEIDVLINNAGLARGLEKVHEGVLRNWEEMIDTNVKGLLYVSRVILPAMVSRGKGDVINIGSIAGHEVYPGGNVYCGSKHAERAISKGMTIDLNGTGVRVTSIDPGMVETEFSLVRFHGDEEKAENVYKGFDPLTGRDVAEIALFCATRPPHVNLQSILVTPTAQATSTMTHKEQ